MLYQRPLRKTTFQQMVEDEERMSKAAGCPPGHTWNPVIKKCLPGSPLSGIDLDQVYKPARPLPEEQITADQPMNMGEMAQKSAPKRMKKAMRMAGEKISPPSMGDMA